MIHNNSTRTRKPLISLLAPQTLNGLQPPPRSLSRPHTIPEQGLCPPQELAEDVQGPELPGQTDWVGFVDGNQVLVIKDTK